VNAEKPLAVVISKNKGNRGENAFRIKDIGFLRLNNSVVDKLGFDGSGELARNQVGESQQ
jgi:hypothetical protein